MRAAASLSGDPLVGPVDRIRIDLGDDDQSHLVDDEHKLAIALLKQYELVSCGI